MFESLQPTDTTSSAKKWAVVGVCAAIAFVIQLTNIALFTRTGLSLNDALWYSKLPYAIGGALGMLMLPAAGAGVFRLAKSTKWHYAFAGTFAAVLFIVLVGLFS